MKYRYGLLCQKSLALAFFTTALCLLSVDSIAQRQIARITKTIDNADRAVISDSHPPLARTENETGRVPPATKLKGVTLFFSRTAAQQADLEALIAAQQDPASNLYHKWLTPDQFAVRFGIADADITKLKTWLEQQGFSIEGVSRSKNSITFSGTVAQMESAFGTELHYYTVNGAKYFAPSKDVSIPAALSTVVAAVNNLSSFRPRPHVKLKSPKLATRPNFTSNQSGDHFLTPNDVATIYNITPAYKAGYTGAGQSIAVVGQSSILLSDIDKFHSAVGLTRKDPTLVLVPDSGTATTVSGDEAESDLDLEYSGGIATAATIYFVYVGNNANYSVFDALNYAVQTRIAPIITISYGVCETVLSLSDYTILTGILAQAASQGQSVISASGDNGSTDCYGTSSLTTVQQQALAVDFPASSQYVTGMGGSEFPAADVASSNTTYWASANGSDVISSALSYIPEQVWNDDSSANGLSAGGGGVSTLTTRPAWQSGVAGIPSGSFRLVPDISLSSSPSNAGYLYCSSDRATEITGSCSNGFRDSNSTYLTVAGGTSFAAPIFAGMLAIINQKLNSTGQGVVNSELYGLAANSASYASAFHDITSAGNQCNAGPSYCSTAGVSEYAAGTGYDQASGLGSVNFYNLLTAWPENSSSLIASMTMLAATTTSPASGANDAITITVASASASTTTTPTGSVSIVVDGSTQNSSLGLSDGMATFNFSSTTSGAHVITATYSGDSIFAGSTGTLTLTVSSSSRGFSLSATNLTVAAGSSGTSTIAISPQNGYTGTIQWTVSSSPTLTNGCVSLPNATVSSAAAVTATMTVFTSASSCTSSSARGSTGNYGQSGSAAQHSSRLGMRLRAFPNLQRLGVLLAGLLFVLLLASLPQDSPKFVSICLLSVCGLVVGCGSSSGDSSSTSKAAKGTYTLTVVGTDTSASSITASTTMTLTIE